MAKTVTTARAIRTNPKGFTDRKAKSMAHKRLDKLKTLEDRLEIRNVQRY